MVHVQKALPGEHSNAKLDLSEEMLKNYGYWLADWRNISKELPQELNDKFPDWDNGENHWQGQVKLSVPDQLPKTREHYGLCHADLHPGNWHVTQDKKMAVFDWERLQKCWYLTDLGSVLFEITWRVRRDLYGNNKESALKE